MIPPILDPGPFSQTSHVVGDQLALLRGRGRPERAPRISFATLGGFDWARLHTIGAEYGEIEEKCRKHGEKAESLWNALYGTQNRAIAFLLSGERKSLRVYYGASPQGSNAVLDSLLQSVWPGTDISNEEFPAVLQNEDHLVVHAAYGIPENFLAPEEGEGNLQLDRLAHALALNPERWGWLVVAWPVTRARLHGYVDDLAERIRTIRIQYMQTNTPGQYDRLASALLEDLEAYLKIVERCIAVGGWLVQGFAFGEVGIATTAVSAVYLSVGGQSSRPEPFHLRMCGNIDSSRQAGWNDVTLLPSDLLAAIAHPPLKEAPGFRVRQIPFFGAEPPCVPPGSTLNLGFIRYHGRPTGGEIKIPPSDLTGHTLVAGTTGAGKTNTIFSLLQQIHQDGNRFIVIEPVKGEYRRLPFDNLRVIEPGRPGNDLRLNPFAFRGVPLSTHIDHLKALFAAAYVLYPPMPYVLEQSLNEVYQDRGWNLATGECAREPAFHLRAFPTLNDLRNKVGEVVGRLGYESRISADIRAGLEVRLDNLRLGPKGRMFDGAGNASLTDLLATPVVLDLSTIGDDEQRAFLMGMLLMMIYEECLEHGPIYGVPMLRYVVVIEEAHRILRRATVAPNEDAANPQARAVELFSSMIAESRAYGVGFVVAEQVPTKIAPEVLKITNLKIVHRLVAEDDRQAMAGTMNLSEDESRVLVGLGPCEALVFGKEMDHPLHVAFPIVLPDKPLERALVAVAVSPKISDRAPALAKEPLVCRAFRRWALSTLEAGEPHVADSVDRVIEAVRRQSLIYLDKNSGEVLLKSLGEILADELAVDLGRRYSWHFAVEEEFAVELKRLWHAALKTERTSLRFDWQRRTRAQHPFPGCAVCESSCRYRAFVGDVSSDSEIKCFRDAIQRPDAPRALAKEALDMATEVVCGDRQILNAVALCWLANHAALYSPLTRDQSDIVNSARQYFQDGEK